MREPLTLAARCRALVLLVTVATPAAAQVQAKKVGYIDTPLIPGQQWRVHDADRPHPAVVQPGTSSTPERAGKAPSDAVVLFDGSNLDAWRGRRQKNRDDHAHWKVEHDYVEVARGGPIRTRQKFGDCQLHIEWQSPAQVKGDSQGRGNSGVFLMDRYEVQVLDSYQNVTYADGQAGALYGQHPPLVNACRKPGEWQSYDIIFEAPRWSDAGELRSPAYVTVLHNGVLIHHRRALVGATTHRQAAKYARHAEQDVIQLQDHGNPTRFRNIWVRRLGAPVAAPGDARKIVR
jgi:hypothetical protein